MPAPAPYRGRFAPSPTGPLHFGSLVAAVGSYLDARHQQGEWLLRIEDIDTPREVPGASDDILRTLEQLGMTWDGPVSYQSKRAHFYQAALEQLQQQGHIYPCACTRRELAGSTVYPGTCREGIPAGRAPRSLRVRVGDNRIDLYDRLQPPLSQRLSNDIGDFIIRRADSLFAYQLAVVVDDGEQQINHIVRGTDLLESTPRQIHLQRLLGLPVPAYLHLPVAVDVTSAKLSKQNFARRIDADDANNAILDALCFLHQPLPDSPRDASQHELWQWAIDHWDIGLIPASSELRAPAHYTESSAS